MLKVLKMQYQDTNLKHFKNCYLRAKDVSLGPLLYKKNAKNVNHLFDGGLFYNDINNTASRFSLFISFSLVSFIMKIKKQ